MIVNGGNDIMLTIAMIMVMVLRMLMILLVMAILLVIVRKVKSEKKNMMRTE